MATFWSRFRVQKVVTKWSQNWTRRRPGTVWSRMASNRVHLRGAHFVSKKCPLIFDHFCVSLSPGGPGGLSLVVGPPFLPLWPVDFTRLSWRYSLMVGEQVALTLLPATRVRFPPRTPPARDHRSLAALFLRALNPRPRHIRDWPTPIPSFREAPLIG